MSTLSLSHDPDYPVVSRSPGSTHPLFDEQHSAEEQLRFDTWLAKSDSYRAAYAEAEKIRTTMDDLKFMPAPGLAEARSAKPRKSLTAHLASRAFFILSSALLGGAWLEYSAETINYATRLGEHRRLELTDHSTIDLNTDNRVSVRISLLQRNVVLTQGEVMAELEPITRFSLALPIPYSLRKRSAVRLIQMILSRFCTPLRPFCRSGRSGTGRKFNGGECGKIKHSDHRLS